MAQHIQFRKGFLKFQRLGTIEFGEQSRWNVRAPEPKGLWAFPFPYFDTFFAHHKWIDIAPKPFRDREPKDPKWYLKDLDHEDDDKQESPDAIEFVEVEAWGEKSFEPFYRDENNELKPAYLSSEHYQAKEKWIDTVGKKVLPVREFWYSGDLYTHFMPNGSVGSAPMFSDDPSVEWNIMSVEKFSKCIKGNKSFSGQYGPDGKPIFWNYGSDHLEVFIPPKRGVFRDKL